ncbi:MAG: tRNA lysidine(34) synthetase TilS [Ruminiclostridium sp.]|nr:tRNA lysidine(34) synthetase TilS [Ruminiclostridium sp.]
MKTKVLDAVRRYGMLNEGDTAVVGLSGGADSCALLLVLLELRETLGITVRACHINHNLRGEESDRDEMFVRELCARRGVPLTVFPVDVRASVEKHESIEEAARRLRYDRFGQMCAEGAKLATAHTANDNAETVLMNLIRGTGTKGLAGIPPVRGAFIRPIIFCTRADTEEYCRKNGIDFVTDSTNLSDDCTRNRIRHRIIPALEEFNPSFIAAVTRMTEAVGDDSAFLDGYAYECAESCRRGDGYDSRRLKELPAPVLFRIIARELKENGVEPSRLRTQQCIGIIEAGMGKVNLCKNKFALVRKKVFYVSTEIQNYRTKQ